MRAVANKSLTAYQTQISEIVQHEFIDPSFDYNDEDFEVLSTIRYDPNFTMPEMMFGQLLQNKDHTALFGLPEHFGLNSDDGSLMDFMLNGSTTGNDKQHDAADIINGLLNTAGGAKTKISIQEKDNMWVLFYNRFLLLGEHFKRLNLSLEYFGWDFHIPLELLLEKLIHALPVDENFNGTLLERMRCLIDDTNCYKMRVLVSCGGRMRIEAHLLPRVAQNSLGATEYFVNTILGGFLPGTEHIWDVFIDSEPLTVSPFTTFKTTKRDHYSAARKRMAEKAKRLEAKSLKSEILVFNSAFELMEGSITNVAVIYKEPNSDRYSYQTPYLSSGCLCGVMRYYLLKKNLISETHIDVRDLKQGDEVLLFNGVMGCVKGIVRNSL
ncbi:LAFE_0E13916g1_1 [Lachancea fermentati]|uniref:LAFE_0E13916g1_1 n=1 Tax=Lachancea fermentati TaxID=4955 RepID=A0A1G4ME25_LACFM|nr:LAFE_0E13916g1_1 [Lachancea fermentati]